MLGALKKTYKYFLNIGVTEDSPAYLVDKIIYCNLVYIFTFLAVLICIPTNYVRHRPIVYTTIYFLVFCVVALFLNHKKKYLPSRLVFLSACYFGVFTISGIQGNRVQMEHYFIPLAIIGFNCFLPTEKRYGVFFGALGLLLFMFFVNRTEPIWDIDSTLNSYSKLDLYINQLAFAVVSFTALLGMSNAFSSAVTLLEAQRTKIERSEKLAILGVMAGGIAHEINNPLAIIEGYGNQLSRDMIPGQTVTDQMKLRLEKLLNTAERIAEIVRGLLDIARPKQTEPLEPVNFDLILNQAISLCENNISAHGIILRIHRNIQETFIVRGRSSQIRQVLVNLLSNAIDATKDAQEKNIDITFEMPNRNFLNLLVSDSGVGIPDPISKKIFDPFFTTKSSGRGTGLGLSISSKLMQVNGGELNLIRNKGPTTFQMKMALDQSDDKV